MAGNVDVDISDRGVYIALHGPTGLVSELRDNIQAATMSWALDLAPINHPLNARHRWGRVGVYKASFRDDRSGSNQHASRFTLFNHADHAYLVEYGRPMTFGYERFAWRKHKPPGATRAHKRGTRGWDGQHVLRDAVNAAVSEFVPGYIPMI